MLFDYNTLPDWQNMAVLERNRLSPRAFFVPYADKGEYAGNTTLGRSSRVLLLDGKWNFRYFPSAMRIPDSETGADTAGYVPIDVPSCWQFQGFEKPYYVNVPFPFPATPPYIPYENPCGVYKRSFALREIRGAVLLTFLGVASAFSVYVNGQFAGYSEGSHMTSEFDVTDAVHTGENHIAVFVYKWCNGSFLECQDMFRLNGIFRSVYLTLCDEASVYDVHVAAELNGNRGTVRLHASLQGDWKGAELVAELSRGGKVLQTVRADASAETVLELETENPCLWSAETPELYELGISLAKGGRVLEYIGQPVGFRKIEIREGVLYFNGRKIKTFGVNHHDTHPEKGYALSPEDMERDILLMKGLNINAVRFSHYPPHPFMLYFCEKYGIYAVDEADIESHGELFMPTGAGTFSRDPAWLPRFEDRIDRMYFRDRNRCCVLMWSLGNESGGGENHEKIYRRLKEYAPEIPVHYEGARDCAGRASDVLSFMYATPDVLREAIASSDRPVFLCEYVHSMGVGPGGVKEYMDLILAEDRMLGGCVWEWAEHSALVDGKLTYGGDNGEYVHDGDFCVDGMMSPYREPTPSAKEIAAAYRPVRAELIPQGIRLRSMLHFRSLALNVRLTFLSEGIVSGQEEFSVCLRPEAEKVLPQPFACAPGCDGYVNIEYIENGALLAREQLCLHAEPPVFAEPDCAAPEVREEEDRFVFRCGDKEISFDKATNTVCSVRAFGREFFNTRPQINRYRTFGERVSGFTYDLIRCGIDNDMYAKENWSKLNLYNVWNNPVGRELSRGKNCCTVAVHSILASPKFGKLLDGKIEYKIYGNGLLKITVSAVPAMSGLADMPKFGVKFEVPRSFDTVEYYGRGEGENYPDFQLSSPVGIYRKRIKELSYPYLKPQEGGNRSDVKRLRLIDGTNGVSLRIAAVGRPLNFNATVYDTADFETVRHNYELQEKDTVNVMVGGYFGGIGSNSCGPRPFESYQLNFDRELSFAFTVEAAKEE